jgi:hypothetical protein
MELKATDTEIDRLFGGRYRFYYCMLEHYKQLGWEDCYEELLPRFAALEEPEEAKGAKDRIQNILKLSPGRSLVLYCAGENAKRLRHYLNQRGMEIGCFSDGNETLWNTQIAGIPCVPPDQLDKEQSVVIVTKDHPEGVVKSLQDKGFQTVLSFKEIGADIYETLPGKNAALKSWEQG